MTPLRLAVAGAGLIGAAHIARIAAAPDCRLVAIADPDAGAARFGVPVYGDLDDLLARERPDGVILATPNQAHRAGAEACLQAGVPVLVEKPVADTLEAARALCAVAAQTGVPVLVGHHRRHSAAIARARQILADGQIGRLVTISGSSWFLKPADYFNVAWRRQPGAGPILINLIHDIDLMRFLCGEVTAVQAMASNAVRGFEVEDSAAILLRFANGALGLFGVSDTAASPWSWELTSGENRSYPRTDQQCYRFAGSEGALSLPDLTLWRYGSRPGWFDPILSAPVSYEDHDPLVRQLSHFCAVIRGQVLPVIDAADATRSLAVLDAVQRAAVTGQVVSVPACSRSLISASSGFV